MCFQFPCQQTFIFHLSYQLILRFRWIRFVTNSFEVQRQPPNPTSARAKKKRKRKHKNTRVVVCKPVIYSAFTLLGPANGIMDRKSPLHFNLDVLQPLPGSCVRPDGTRWSVPRYSAPLWDPGSVKMHCGCVMISNYVDAEAVGRWSWRGESEEGGKVSRTKCDLWKNFHVYTDVSQNCTSGLREFIFRRPACISLRRPG